jgi:hypothetical protein
MTDLERLHRAIQWLDIVASETIELVTNDYIFWEVENIIGTNRRLRNAESVFFAWLSSTFAHSVAAAVRRQASLNNQSVSLHRLLDELKKFPHLISREYHRSLYAHCGSKYILESADKIYDEYVGPKLKMLDPSQVQKDIDLLVRASEKIRHYTDRVVAHYDQRGLSQAVPTFSDLKYCLLEFDELVCKYLLLMKAEPKITLLPTFLYDWKSIFRFAWIDNDKGVSPQPLNR